MPTLLPPTRPPVSLRFLFPRASFVGCADVLVSHVAHDSRQCQAGTTFAALPGSKHQGADFAAQAVSRGAVSILAEAPLPQIPVPQCIVPNVRAAHARLCAALHGQPSRYLKTVGVTGTNGKTTVTWLVRAILISAGHRCGLLGSIEYSDGVRSTPATLTTPEAETLNGTLKEMYQRGVSFAALEISSHALHQDRIAGTELDVAVVTNITQDHFDYHGDFEHYRDSKARILDLCKRGGRVVLNADDRHVRRLASRCGKTHTAVTFGLSANADVSAEVIDESLRGTSFLLRSNGEEIEVRTPLIGRHNVSNCLAASAAVSAFGLSLDEIAHGMASLESVPGRLERLDAAAPFAAFVDYAHTDDALRQSIRALKRLCAGRVICVFGAGGDRDRSKRPLLGRAALEADEIIVTSDNPRSEDPQHIIADILRGIPSERPVQVHPLREVAILHAVQSAEAGDCLLVAGKGHETEQIIGTQHRPFDDRIVLRRAILDVCRNVLPLPLRQPA